jgi:hypothetical protein
MGYFCEKKVNLVGMSSFQRSRFLFSESAIPLPNGGKLPLPLLLALSNLPLQRIDGASVGCGLCLIGAFNFGIVLH